MNHGPEAPPAPRILRALLVEDSPLDAELLLRALERQGWAPAAQRVETGEELRQALAGEEWDIVLSDYSLPRCSVGEVLDVLRAAGRDVPLIVLSGTVGEEAAVATMKAGAHDFFLKDRLARLGSAIERELAEAEVRRERRLARARLVERERELQVAVRARDEFLAIASHELRTPITSLELQLQSLRRLAGASPPPSVADDRIQGKCESMARQVERLTVLVANLLDVGQLAGGRLRLAREPVDLTEVVREVLERQQDAIRRSGSEVVVDAPGPVVGGWDRLRIETAVMNLVSNAVKFGAGRPIGIAVSVAAGHALLTVRDQGIGIAPEDQGRVFERFERAVSVRHFGGFGIGLWVVRQVVEAHGGAIRVRSEPGDGSEFTLELPLVPAEEGRSIPAQ